MRSPTGPRVGSAAPRSRAFALRRVRSSSSSEEMDRGIRVNGVAPGPIWTPLIPASFPAEKSSEFG